jgi:hypothetical protein
MNLITHDEAHADIRNQFFYLRDEVPLWSIHVEEVHFLNPQSEREDPNLSQYLEFCEGQQNRPQGANQGI